MADPPPGAMLPSEMGSGEPVAEPRVAAVSLTFWAVPVPLLVMVTTAW